MNFMQTLIVISDPDATENDKRNSGYAMKRGREVRGRFSYVHMRRVKHLRTQCIIRTKVKKKTSENEKNLSHHYLLILLGLAPIDVESC